MFRIRPPYGRLSLTVNDRTLVATDLQGREHHLRLGDRPGQVLEIDLWEVVVDPGSESQRLVDGWVGVDIDDQPLLVLYPATDWADVGVWCEINGIPGRPGPHGPPDVGEDPVAARKWVELAPAEEPLRAGPDTVVLEKKSAEARSGWRTMSFLCLGPWVLAAWMALSFAVGIPPWLGWTPPVVLYFAALVTFGLGCGRPFRLDDEQHRDLRAVLPDEPPQPQLVRSRPPRPRRATAEESRQLAHIRGHAILRPIRTLPVRADAFSRNVSLRIVDHVLILTDETADEHRFPLGDRPGELHGLDLCRWVKKQDGPPSQRRGIAHYLVGIDADRTALFAVTPLKRWRRTEIVTWARLHHLPLTESPVIYDYDPDTGDAVAIEAPAHTPETLLVGNHRSGRLRWERTVVAWAAAFAWAPVAYSTLGLSIWLAPLLLIGLTTYTGDRIRRRLHVARQRTQVLNTWQLALTIPDD